jgi:hypothetical protein
LSRSWEVLKRSRAKRRWVAKWRLRGSWWRRGRSAVEGEAGGAGVDIPGAGKEEGGHELAVRGTFAEFGGEEVGAAVAGGGFKETGEGFEFGGEGDEGGGDLGVEAGEEEERAAGPFRADRYSGGRFGEDRGMEGW